MQQRDEAAPIEFAFARTVQAAQLDQGWQNVNIGCQPVHVATCVQAAARPVHKKGHAVTAVILRALFPSHSGVESAGDKLILIHLQAACGAVVRHEDKDRVFFQLQLS